jgi:hypothetical protein
MAAAIAITWLDLEALGLRRPAGRTRDAAAARRRPALASVVDGASTSGLTATGLRITIKM